MPEDSQNPVLDYGNDAVQEPVYDVVQKPADAALGYGNTALGNAAVKPQKVTPQAPASPPRELIIIGNGYPKYKDISAEIQAIKQDHYYHPNEAMELTAKDIGTNIHKIKNAKGFFDVLNSQSGPFNKVVWIGHGNEDSLMPSFPTDGGSGPILYITSNDFTNIQKSKRESIVSKLTPEAEVYLISCSFSQNESFKQTVANFFQRCVKSFVEEVRTCVMYTKDEKQVIRSGRLALDSDYRKKIANLPHCNDTTLWKKGLDLFNVGSITTCPPPPPPPAPLPPATTPPVNHTLPAPLPPATTPPPPPVNHR